MYGFDESIQANFERFAALGLKVAVTEADVRMPLGDDGEPDAAQIALQAERYDKMLQACVNVSACTSFTVGASTTGAPGSRASSPRATRRS